ncbi:MAG: PAS domain S-box protein [Longimicrobiales bacterium]
MTSKLLPREAASDGERIDACAAGTGRSRPDDPTAAVHTSAPDLERDARFREAFRYSPIGMALVDLDGGWLALNDAVAGIVGYGPDYLLERGFQDITHPDDLEEDLDNVRRLVAGEFPFYRMEKRYIHAQGHHVWVDLTVTLVRDGEGAPAYFVAQIQDISERKSAEREKQANDERYRALARSFPGGAVVLFDHDLRYTLAEGLGLSAAGLRRDMLEGRTIWEVFPKETTDQMEDQYRAALAGEEVATEVAHGDKVYHTWASPVRDGQGRIVGGMVTTLDITERVRGEESRVLAGRLDGLVKLTAGFAHEFNNRFTAILPGLEMIKADLPEGSELRRDVEAVERDALAASNVVHKLWAFNRCESRTVERVIGDPTISWALGELMQGGAPGVRCRFVPGAPGATVELDPDGLRAVLDCIVANALDAMPGGGSLTLRSGMLRGGEARAVSGAERPLMALSIQDDGVGMDAAVRARAFEPFFTTHEPSSRNGLGLATVYGFMQRIGGQASLASTPGAGTTVTLYFPMVEGAAVTP